MRVEIPVKQWGRDYFCQAHTNGECTYCAMGFVLKALGFTDAELLNQASLSDLDGRKVMARVPEELFDRYGLFDDNWVHASPLLVRITDINDSMSLPDDEKRTCLQRLLEPLGFEVTFVDEGDHVRQ